MEDSAGGFPVTGVVVKGPNRYLVWSNRSNESIGKRLREEPEVACWGVRWFNLSR
jgi:hypothetical protein